MTSLLKSKYTKTYVEKFKDGRPPIEHNHPYWPLRGKRPRPPGPLKRLVTRKEWKAKAPEYGDNLFQLDLPVTHIRYVDSKTKICRNFLECSDVLQKLQWKNMKKGLPDMKYNFYIAPDGAVFEGRGWNHAGEKLKELGDLPRSKVVDVAFIGKYLNKRLPRYMAVAALDLIDWGVHHFKVKCCYEAIPLKTNVVKGTKKPRTVLLEEPEFENQAIASDLEEETENSS